MGSCRAKVLSSLSEPSSSSLSVGDGLGDEEDTVGGKPPSEVTTGLDVGAGGGDDGLEDEEDTVGDELPSEVNTKDVGVGEGKSGIPVEVALTTARPGPGAEFIPS